LFGTQTVSTFTLSFCFELKLFQRVHFGRFVWNSNRFNVHFGRLFGTQTVSTFTLVVLFGTSNRFNVHLVVLFGTQTVSTFLWSFCFELKPFQRSLWSFCLELKPRFNVHFGSFVLNQTVSTFTLVVLFGTQTVSTVHFGRFVWNSRFQRSLCRFVLELKPFQRSLWSFCLELREPFQRSLWSFYKLKPFQRSLWSFCLEPNRFNVHFGRFVWNQSVSTFTLVVLELKPRNVHLVVLFKLKPFQRSAKAGYDTTYAGSIWTPFIPTSR
jgi:hypothetical protein